MKILNINKIISKSLGNNFDKKNQLILALIIIFGFLLRLFYLTQESIWMDEYFTIISSKLPFSEMIYERLIKGHAPVYFVFMKIWIAIFGDSDFSLRLPSLIFGALSIYAIYLVGKKMFSRKIGLIAAFIFAVSPVYIEYSQEARMYSLVVLLVLLSVYFLFLAMETNFQKGRLLFAFCLLLALYTHIYALFFAVFLFIYLTLKYFRKQEFYRVIETMGFVLVFYFPWLAFSFFEFLSPKAGNPLFMLSVYEYSVFDLFINFFVRTKIAANLPETANYGYVPNILLIALAVLAIYGNFLDKKNQQARKKEIWFLLGWLIIPVLIARAISFFWKNIFGVQYLLYVGPAAYLIFANGFIQLKNYIKNKKIFIAIVAAAALILLAYNFVSLYNFYSRFHKPPWKQVVSYIEENKNDSKIIFVFGAAADTAPVISRYASADISVVTDLANYMDLLSQNDFWLISYLGQSIDINFDFIETIMEKKLVKKQLVDKIIIYLFSDSSG